jgi:uncharacterized protein (DUF433 family)
MTDDSKLLERIATDHRICGGRPTVRGTRIRVSNVLEMLGSGMTVPEIIGDYPELSELDVRAVAIYAARALSHPVMRAA